MGIEDLEWRLIREEARSGAMHMALDEVAAETAAEGGLATVRVYRWKPSTLSLGYGQDPDTVDWEYCESEGIDVVRRPTGGGGIFHHAVGDVSYSIVLPAAAVDATPRDAYRLLCEPLLATFDRMHVDAAHADREREGIYEPACYLRGIEPPHDIVVVGDPPRKISGNAQYRQKDAIVQHGSITFSAFPEQHLAVFEDLDASVEEFNEHATAIDEYTAEPRTGVVGLLEAMLKEWSGAREGSWTAAEIDRGHELVTQKYDTEEWIRREPNQGDTEK